LVRLPVMITRLMFVAATGISTFLDSLSGSPV
jgi:hypothetical protein